MNVHIKQKSVKRAQSQSGVLEHACLSTPVCILCIVYKCKIHIDIQTYHDCLNETSFK